MTVCGPWWVDPSVDCGSCGPHYWCHPNGMCLYWDRDAVSPADSTRWAHTTSGGTVDLGREYCCRLDTGWDNLGQWPDGTIACCLARFPWPCVTAAGNVCCAFPGDTTYTYRNTETIGC
jgi:hypothetical protein